MLPMFLCQGAGLGSSAAGDGHLVLPGPSTAHRVPKEDPGFISMVPSLLCSPGT